MLPPTYKLPPTPTPPVTTSAPVELEVDVDSNSMDIFIDYGDSKRIIELASGMEKMIASLAIRVALINVSSLPKSDIFVIEFSLDTPSKGGSFVIKAANKCWGVNNPAYAFTHDCTPPPVCYQEESAWASGTRYVSRGNWATFTPYAAGTVNVWAGQNKLAGTATFSAVTNGKVTISIKLDANWSLQEVSNPVKIMGYSTQPSGNPSPGRFTSKGSSLTVTLDAANYYGIHLDVREAVECPE